AVPAQRYHLPVRVAGLGANRMKKSVGDGTVVERAHDSPFAVHSQVARGPDRWRSDIARENRILRCYFVEDVNNVLRTNRLLVRLMRLQLIQARARVAVMFEGVIEVGYRSLLLQLRQQCTESSLRVSHETKVDLRAAAELLASSVNLNNDGVFRKELLIGKV